MQLNRVAAIVWMLLFTSCASAAWREGWRTERELILVGFGKPIESESDLQRKASAQEAAVLDALGHFSQYCPVVQDNSVNRFRIENQRKRKFSCTDESCRVRIIIETARAQCRS